MQRRDCSPDVIDELDLSIQTETTKIKRIIHAHIVSEGYDRKGLRNDYISASSRSIETTIRAGIMCKGWCWWMEPLDEVRSGASRTVLRI